METAKEYLEDQRLGLLMRFLLTRGDLAEIHLEKALATSFEKELWIGTYNPRGRHQDQGSSCLLLFGKSNVSLFWMARGIQSFGQDDQVEGEQDRGYLHDL